MRLSNQKIAYLIVGNKCSVVISVPPRIFEIIFITRCVICRLLVLWGGRSVEFFRNFRHTYLIGFYRYNSNQVVKKHLCDQENRLARTKRARTRLRARKPRLRPVNPEKSRKMLILYVTCFGP